MMNRILHLTGRVALFALVFNVLSCSPPREESITEEATVDLEEIKKIRIAFQEAWLRSDSAAVMNLMTEDVIFMPHHGDDMVIGRDQLAEYWFSPQYPPTEVLTFTADFQGAEGSGDIGFSYGRFRLVYNFDGYRYENGGNFLTTVKKVDTEWKISRLIFNDPQPTKTKL